MIRSESSFFDLNQYIPLMDYEVQRCTRLCAVTEREFGPGETFYSALVTDAGEIQRRDYSAEAWRDKPEAGNDQLLGWWKSRMPDRTRQKKNWAPNEVMLQFFDELSSKELDGDDGLSDDESEAATSKADLRYILALLLVRRRVFRLEESDDEGAGETMAVYCSRRDETYTIGVVTPEPGRVKAIQEELAKLLQ